MEHARLNPTARGKLKARLAMVKRTADSRGSGSPAGGARRGAVFTGWSFAEESQSYWRWTSNDIGSLRPDIGAASTRLESRNANWEQMRQRRIQGLRANVRTLCTCPP